MLMRKARRLVHAAVSAAAAMMATSSITGRASLLGRIAVAIATS